MPIDHIASGADLPIAQIDAMSTDSPSGSDALAEWRRRGVWKYSNAAEFRRFIHGYDRVVSKGKRSVGGHRKACMGTETVPERDKLYRGCEFTVSKAIVPHIDVVTAPPRHRSAGPTAAEDVTPRRRGRHLRPRLTLRASSSRPSGNSLRRRMMRIRCALVTGSRMPYASRPRPQEHGHGLRLRCGRCSNEALVEYFACHVVGGDNNIRCIVNRQGQAMTSATIDSTGHPSFSLGKSNCGGAGLGCTPLLEGGWRVGNLDGYRCSRTLPSRQNLDGDRINPGAIAGWDVFNNGPISPGISRNCGSWTTVESVVDRVLKRSGLVGRYFEIKRPSLDRRTERRVDRRTAQQPFAQARVTMIPRVPWTHRQFPPPGLSHRCHRRTSQGWSCTPSPQRGTRCT